VAVLPVRGRCGLRQSALRKANQMRLESTVGQEPVKAFFAADWSVSVHEDDVCVRVRAGWFFGGQ
jgi:hypothetical protein